MDSPRSPAALTVPSGGGETTAAAAATTPNHKKSRIIHFDLPESLTPQQRRRRRSNHQNNGGWTILSLPSLSASTRSLSYSFSHHHSKTKHSHTNNNNNNNNNNNRKSLAPPGGRLKLLRKFCLGLACLYGSFAVFHSMSLSRYAISSSSSSFTASSLTTSLAADLNLMSTFLSLTSSSHMNAGDSDYGSNSLSRLLSSSASAAAYASPKALPAPPVVPKKPKLKICFLTSIAQDDAMTPFPLKYPTVDVLEPILDFRQKASSIVLKRYDVSWDFFVFSDRPPPMHTVRGWNVLDQPDLLKRPYHPTFDQTKNNHNNNNTNNNTSETLTPTSPTKRGSMSLETLERWGQYVPWQNNRVRQRCDVAFFLSYLESLIPLAEPRAFVALALQVQHQASGVAVHRDPRFPTLQDLYLRLRNNNTTTTTPPSSLSTTKTTNSTTVVDPTKIQPPDELLLKVQEREWNQTLQLLQQQADDWNDAPVYQTTWMAMDLKNERLRNMTLDFWNAYQSEQYTVYDAFLFSFWLHKNGMKPLTSAWNATTTNTTTTTSGRMAPTLPPLQQLMDLGWGRVVPTKRNAVGRLVITPPPPLAIVNSRSRGHVTTDPNKESQLRYTLDLFLQQDVPDFVKSRDRVRRQQLAKYSNSTTIILRRKRRLLKQKQQQQQLLLQQQRTRRRRRRHFTTASTTTTTSLAARTTTTSSSSSSSHSSIPSELMAQPKEYPNPQALVAFAGQVSEWARLRGTTASNATTTSRHQNNSNNNNTNSGGGLVTLINHQNLNETPPLLVPETKS
ncbi:hypothetical protein ACA910_002106 [Epithemia clementina (nom. ined.)]